jgi:ubiquinone/menaquinone biosynthesis C-methylase UbiE
MREIRPRIIDEAKGRVLEIGAGTGHSLPYYRGKTFDELVLSDPDPYMLQRLEKKLAAAGIEAKVARAPGEELPFPDAPFDAVLSVHVLCSVQSIKKTLSEVRRVLKPNGQFRFFDHVRSRNRLGALVQDLVQPLWGQFSGGCHPNRDVAAAVERAGFEFAELERLRPFPALQPMIFQAISRPHVLGVAVPTSSS